MAGLPPSARLRRAAEFAAFRTASGKVQTRHFLVRTLPSAAGHPRLGLAVSRKVSKRAVARNRIKRIIRESFRVQRSALPAVDVLVIARSSAAATDNPSLRADLEAAWQKLAALMAKAAPGTMGG
ncbi:MAG TPA: ribonuclease P protein component [Luteimonas sp.]|nr:ribonuclease P protein component [Luteimonas sp.]